VARTYKLDHFTKGTGASVTPVDGKTEAAEREQSVRVEIERRTMAGSDRVVAATDVDRAQIIRHYGAPAPIAVIPGGVDLERFRPLDQARARASLGLTDASKVLLFVGRIQRLKGLEVLLPAFALLGFEARLLVVGGRPSSTLEAREIGRLEQLAGRLGIAERVTFVGAVSHERLPVYYAAADATVMPSSYESFGLVAVESLACGRPVVATRIGGLRTIVRDGETGLLVPWRDPAMFAEALRRILLDDRLRARLAAAARPSVVRFGWDRTAEEHLALYADVLAERARAAVAGQ
jgi:D-inositol-3-phosphate glycosyltransferase